MEPPIPDIFAFRGLEDADTMICYPFVPPGHFFPPDGFQIDCTLVPSAPDELFSPASICVSPDSLPSQAWGQDYSPHVDGAPSFWMPEFGQDFPQLTRFNSVALSPAATAYPSPETLLSDHSSPAGRGDPPSQRSPPTAHNHERLAQQQPTTPTIRHHTILSKPLKPPRARRKVEASIEDGVSNAPDDQPSHNERAMATRKRTAGMEIESGGDDENEVDIARVPNDRVKTRAAAKRCREKSRKQEQELVRQEKQEHDRHRLLNGYVRELRDQVLFLKNEILRHGECDCEMIQLYISKAAGQIA